MEQKYILVIGDCIEDIWLPVRDVGLCTEEPCLYGTPNYEKLKRELGGAANVAANINAAGHRTKFITRWQSPQQDPLVLPTVRGSTVHCVDEFYSPPSKTRYLSQSRQLLRIDEEHATRTKVLDSQSIEFIVGHIGNIRDYDAVIVVDYGRGMVDRGWTQHLNGAPFVAVDPHPSTRYDFNMDLMTPSQAEDEKVDVWFEDGYSSKMYFITNGEHGALHIEPKTHMAHYRSSTVINPICTVGAGNAFIVACVLGILGAHPTWRQTAVDQASLSCMMPFGCRLQHKDYMAD